MKLRFTSLAIVAFLIGCGDTAAPTLDVDLTFVNPVITPNTGAAVSITNNTPSLVFVRNYSEIEYLAGSEWSLISAGPCGFDVDRWWLILRAGESVVCRHGLASTRPNGEYRLGLVIQQDTIWRGKPNASVRFRLGN